MERSKGTDNLDFRGRLLGICESFTLRGVMRVSRGLHLQGSAGRGLLGSSTFGSVLKTMAEPSRYGCVGMITVLGQLPVFANIATFGYPSAAREGGGKLELERKQTSPLSPVIQPGGQSRNFRALLQAQSQERWALPHVCPRWGWVRGSPLLQLARSKWLGSHPEFLGGSLPSRTAPFPQVSRPERELLGAL